MGITEVGGEKTVAVLPHRGEWMDSRETYISIGKEENSQESP